jgi:hypothetical protein
VLTLPIDDYQWFVDQALESMVAIVRQLGDAEANRRPALDGANTPFAILTHCLGVMEFWGGQVVAGRVIQRDRAAEFVASGPVAGLVAAAKRAMDAFRADVATADPAAPPRSAGRRASGTTQPQAPLRCPGAADQPPAPPDCAPPAPPSALPSCAPRARRPAREARK